MQVLLAAAFGMTGVMKSTRPREQLAESMDWVEDFSAGTVRFIGVAELVGALGLVLPAVTGIAPWLTPTAAIGLAIVMVLAAVTHVRRSEPSAIAINAVLFALAAFVAWGRFGPYAFD